MLNIDDLKRIRTAIQTTPIIDNHAHNLLDKSSANHIPFESITTEAGEEALKTTFSSLSHLRARQQLKELYDYDGHDDNWDWPRLLKLRQDWMDNRQHELYQKCFKGTHVILMDDGLNLSGDVHSYQWHDQYTAAPTKRIVRIEREAELIMERLLATADPADAKSEEFQQKVHHSFAEMFDRSIKDLIDDDEVAGFKSVICYRSGLDINASYEPVLQDILEPMSQYIYHAATYIDKAKRFRFDSKPLNDYLLLKTMQILAESAKPKPIQFHTGLGDNDINIIRSNPGYMQPLIEAYPSVPIVLLHSSYPFTREAGYLATVFKNVYLDLGEVFPMLNRDGQVSVVKEAMELTPMEKLLWSTDGHLFAETYWLANKQFREVLEEVLIHQVEEGQYDTIRAMRFVENILFENSNKLYDLRLSLPEIGEQVKYSSSKELSWSSIGMSGRLPHDCEYVMVQWVTYMGEIRVRVLPARQFKKMVSSEGSKRFGISRGNTGTLQNDTTTSVVNTTGQVCVEPQLSTLRPNGIQRPDNKTAYFSVMSRWTDDDGVPIEACPIHALTKSLDALESEFGVSLKIGFELELVFLKRQPGQPSTYEPLTTMHAWSTLSSEDYSIALPLLTAIEERLHNCGIEVIQFHSESAPGQYEIVLGPLPILQSIHSLYQTRQIIQQVAELYASDDAPKIRATFHASPIEDKGNASHAHISLNDIRAGSNKPQTDKEMALVETHFWASVLSHISAICALSMPQAESYKRVVENHWSGGIWIAWGTQNREVPLRRIGNGTFRWEIRCLDGFANMYIAMAALTAAGLDGLRNRKKMESQDCDVNPSKVNEEKRKIYGISKQLPRTIDEAIQALEKDEDMKKWLGSIYHDYLAMKKVEQEMLGNMSEQERRAFLIERY